MLPPDLNLLHTLDVLLSEGSVVRAAARLQLSPSAMSRALTRLRTVTGDPLLVRAGRGLVPTPRATEMKAKVRELVEEAFILLRPADRLELATLERSFTFRTSDGFAETFGPPLIERVQQEAPRVRLRFVRKLDKSSEGLRDGSVDLETGVVAGTSGPEVRAQALFTDRYVGVVRRNHPLARTGVTLADYAAWSHVVAWRQGMDLGGIDEMLEDAGLARNVMTSVDGFSAALALARGSDLIATAPEKHTAALRDGMYSFPLPLAVNAFTISLLWHPRLDGDPAHRWLRGCVQGACHPGGR
ncbi:LysR family transcriptional regulator [Sphingomonas sp. AR_OL41]|uniref:LysR family transcriptional regulator n=1 Tax=Sphingomonas sp. AR_OL41 TaxID=3042729 RepID=UPI0024814C96|nr:LysR family transcriptional regulator [Sphingomonas sp. AR_OL41]MDH7974925.1 LysR family transcriptional regulator [Sphingomonas sp. AR_OL41]